MCLQDPFTHILAPIQNKPAAFGGLIVSRLLDALAKVGLIELDAPDRPAEATAGEFSFGRTPDSGEPSSSTAETPFPRSTLGAEGIGTTDILEQRAFSDIYSVAGTPPSPFAAEKLLRILDGLRAMDASTRKAAVLAMDAADDEWVIEDAVSDAREKIKALEQARTDLDTAVKQAETQAHADNETREKYQQEATASIRKQIAELEALLERELQKVTEERAAIQARLQRMREAAARESARISQEVARLREVVDSFAMPTPEQTKAKE